MKGKEKCDFLRSIRKEIADKNGIEYAPEPCTHEGDCLGTCPACDKEADYIMEELRKMKVDGKEIDTDTERLKELERYVGSMDDDEIQEVGKMSEMEPLRGIPEPQDDFFKETGDIAAPEHMEDEDEDVHVLMGDVAVPDYMDDEDKD